MQSVTNISYKIVEYSVEFSFRLTTHNNSLYTCILQLPDTADSIHQIDNKEYEEYTSWGKNEEKVAEWDEIIKSLKKYFYNDFKDDNCAAASCVVCERVYHVEQIMNKGSDDYVAFLANREVVLRLGDASQYYNVIYFQNPEFNKFVDEYGYEIDGYEEDVIKKAKKSFFSMLAKSLENKIQNTWNSVELCDLQEEHFDEDVSEFMRDEFGYEWENIELGVSFYENYACDIRGDFDQKLLEKNNA